MVLKIGTRKSLLAQWQALEVQHQLKQKGLESVLVFIESDGDINLKSPLYELGIQGIFTKALDIALLNNQIDIAVHSYKDVPTVMAQGLELKGVLPRGNYYDTLVIRDKNIYNDKDNMACVIGSSSIRRIAQWRHKYPHHKFENLRGNVNSRLEKLKHSQWMGAIFAAAGLERLKLYEQYQCIDLEWMTPAPAQGIVAIVGKKDNIRYDAYFKMINDEHTAICARVEKDFLHHLMGGCSVPIGGLAKINDNTIDFKGNICSIDGEKNKIVTLTTSINDYETLGKKAAEKIKSDLNIILR